MSLRRYVELTIAESATESPVAGLDTDELTIVGIKCPADVNSETTLSFWHSPGKAADLPAQSTPTADGDYDVFEDDTGAGITVAIANGVTRSFTNAKAALFMTMNRYVRIVVSGGAPAGGLTFGLTLRKL